MANKLYQKAPFIIWEGGGNTNKIIAEVSGLGMVTINRTSEGLIIDVHDNSQSHDSLASIALEDTDFIENFHSAVAKLVSSFSSDLEIDQETIEKGYRDGLTPRLMCAKILWQSLEDVPINDEEEIDTTWLCFDKGTDRLAIWHFFEESFDCSVAKDLMMVEGDNSLSHDDVSSIENYHVVVMSTGHLSEKDADHLSTSERNGDPMVLERDTGFFIKLYCDGEHNRRDGASESLKSIIDWAVREGYRMIEFDSDADLVAPFPVFDW